MLKMSLRAVCVINTMRLVCAYGFAASQLPDTNVATQTLWSAKCLTSVYMLTFIRRLGQAIHARLIDDPRVTVHFLT